jgi:hypothetical protein
VHFLNFEGASERVSECFARDKTTPRARDR